MASTFRNALFGLVVIGASACQESAVTQASQEASAVVSAAPVAVSTATVASSGPPSDPSAARGGLWGDEVLDPAGSGGLGLTGSGNPSHKRYCVGANCGSASPPRARPPSVRMGATSVSGRLPPEVIQRIVRQNFGRFRLCYEKALKQEPTLEGKVSVDFTIGKDGSVSGVKTAGSTLKSDEVQKCVAKAFTGLSFPQPEGGVVKVTYPIAFSPGDDVKLGTVGGKTLAEATPGDLEKALKDAGYTDITSKPKEGAKGAVVVTAKKDQKTFTVTFVPASAQKAIPALEFERLGKMGVVLREGGSFLAVESDDEKASRELLDAIVKR